MLYLGLPEVDMDHRTSINLSLVSLVEASFVSIFGPKSDTEIIPHNLYPDTEME